MRLLTITVAVLLPVTLMADVIYRNDGTKVEGTFKRTNDGWEVTTSGGQVVQVAEADVQRIELGGSKASPADTGKGLLVAVRQMAESQSDVNVIIQRYDTLLKQLGNSPLAEEARKDAEMWRDRLARGMVKIGGKWMEKAEATAALEKVGGMVEQALASLKQGRFPEAEKTIDQALAADPQNPSALFLKGLLQLKANQLGWARKSFEAAGAALPDHAPTLNNMAVTQWRQRAYAQALMNYEKAMAAMPDSPIIFDNVAETLHDVPREVTRTAVYIRIVRKFEVGDAQLQKLQEQAGLYRWGGTWVTAAQRDELHKQEQAIKTKMADLDKEYEATQARMEKLVMDIDSDRRSMTNMDASRNHTDAQGRNYQTPLPDSYYQLQRDIDRMESQRVQEMRKLQSLKAEAGRVQQQIAVPPYTGVQRIMEEEFMPPLRGTAKAAEIPATQPATMPAATPAIAPAAQ